MSNYFPKRISPDVTVGGCIDIFENAWPNWQQTINDIEKTISDQDNMIHWEKATTLDYDPNNLQSARTNLHIGISGTYVQTGNEVFRQVNNQMYNLIWDTVVGYHERYGIGNKFWDEEGYNLLKYSGGQEYKCHFDGPTGRGRHLSVLLYLNDNFEGGELEFPFHKVKIKPQAGMLLLFPSNYAYAHIAHPVTQGTKYAIVTWLHDREIGQ